MGRGSNNSKRKGDLCLFTHMYSLHEISLKMGKAEILKQKSLDGACLS